eukprot:snap_masked-scaffold_22-processed-gene-2.23-mRNA-1 protein AED:1.00 eAED:1.00 QI:0/-1/0/0/-1/1/1/0/64
MKLEDDILLVVNRLVTPRKCSSKIVLSIHSEIDSPSTTGETYYLKKFYVEEPNRSQLNILVGSY